ncbi:hypothetical protein BGW36DRAFT_138824 [Talaromyces proteolyticus]|uniref:SMP-30/Gluconolactonase/LRE-like region domain-containing protein n=1 Tax=Talaromyces proteolyticus TaxID=1131652 RepID=A0AAD4Q0L7_9EURO|nr:uncharacterized protein BGW36DRAFT_138824 [Talaromyces proteolyticus]KAH8700969.1 hypothetical protein BGW36DRAFT_138824 [Talaromyces proteolyticus]
MQKFKITQPFLDLKCGLSEGPFYEQSTNTLRFIDIAKRHTWWVDLNVGPSSAKKFGYDISFGVTANLASSKDSFLFGGKHGVGIAKRNSNEYRYIQRFWNDAETSKGYENIMRANDGGVDSQGRFWVGAMNDPAVTNGKFDPVGTLFRLDIDGSFHRMLENVTIPNGISWSLDDKTMYWTDTPTGNIYAFDFDASTGNITNQRVFWHSDEGGPDGHAMDEEGNLWVALWGAWKVVKVSPKGKVTAEIEVPTRCPTAVAFADEDVYITSEEDPEVDKYPESGKWHGGVFKCHVGVRGRKLFDAQIPC